MAQLRDPTYAEQALLDAIERGGKSPNGRLAAHVRLSSLESVDRSERYLRIAAQLFAPLEASGAVAVHALSNGDIVVLGKDTPEGPINAVVNRIRELFSHDPLTWAEPGDEADPFVDWYAFEADYPALERVGRILLERAEARKRERPQARALISPADLAWLQARLEAADIRKALKRQPCFKIANDRATIAFEEFFVSLADFEAAVLPEKTLRADVWMFQEFSKSLDQAVLAVLPSSQAMGAPQRVSLNLNLESCRSRAFQSLVEALGVNRSVCVEVQLIDVFTNPDMYFETRDAFRKQGRAILIDGLTPLTAGALDFGLLDPDFVKVSWSPELAFGDAERSRADITALIETMGPGRVILSRCDAEAAVLWGLERGIDLYQGRFLDLVLGAMTLKVCPRSSACENWECAQRRSAVDPRVRRRCPHPPGLDMLSSFIAPTQTVGKPSRAGASAPGEGTAS